MEGIKPPSTKQDKNEEALTKYAAFLCVLMLLVIAIRWLRNIHITSPHLKTSASLPTYGREACFLVFQYVKVSAYSDSTILMLFIEVSKDVYRTRGSDDLPWGSS